MRVYDNIFPHLLTIAYFQKNIAQSMQEYKKYSKCLVFRPKE